MVSLPACHHPLCDGSVSDAGDPGRARVVVVLSWVPPLLAIQGRQEPYTGIATIARDCHTVSLLSSIASLSRLSQLSPLSHSLGGLREGSIQHTHLISPAHASSSDLFITSSQIINYRHSYRETS